MLLITIENLSIKEWNQLEKYSQISLFKAFTDRNGTAIQIGNQSKDKNHLAILNYNVGLIKVSRANNNWQDINLADV